MAEYIKRTWANGEIITEEKLNNIETGISQALKDAEQSGVTANAAKETATAAKTAADTAAATASSASSTANNAKTAADNAGTTAAAAKNAADAAAAAATAAKNTADAAAATATAANNDGTQHAANKSNPHGVTASQVGLGNVPNVSTNNQTPTFTQASALSNISSGEKMSVLFGKIAKGLADLISHLANKSNPHGVTAAQIGAVPSATGGENRINVGTKNDTQYRLAITSTGKLRFDVSNDGGVNWDILYYVPRGAVSNIFTALNSAGDTFGANAVLFKSPSSAGSVGFHNGASANQGAGIWLYGNDHPTGAGKFRLQVYDAATGTYRQLDGAPDGSLIWDKNHVFTAADIIPFENLDVSRDNIGAAPAHLVHSSYELSSDADLDALLLAQFADATLPNHSVRYISVFFSNTSDTDIFYAGRWLFEINKETINYGYVIARSYFDTSSVSERRRRVSSGSFSHPWSWDNPPMVAGVEYMTTQKIYQKPIYCKSISYTQSADIGTATGLDTMNIAHGISGFGELVRCEGRRGNMPLPQVSWTGSKVAAISIQQVNATNIVLSTINTTSAKDGPDWTFVLYYTKS